MLNIWQTGSVVATTANSKQRRGRQRAAARLWQAAAAVQTFMSLGQVACLSLGSR